MDMVEKFTAYSPFVKSSFYFGGNIPGKPSRMQQNPGGRAQMMAFFAKAKDDHYQGVLRGEPAGRVVQGVREPAVSTSERSAERDTGLSS